MEPKRSELELPGTTLLLDAGFSAKTEDDEEVLLSLDFAEFEDFAEALDFSLSMDFAESEDFAEALDLALPLDFAEFEDFAEALDFALPLDFAEFEDFAEALDFAEFEDLEALVVAEDEDSETSLFVSFGLTDEESSPQAVNTTAASRDKAREKFLRIKFPFFANIVKACILTSQTIKR